MKKILLGLVVLIASGFLAPKTKELTPEDRKFAVDYFIKTRERLLKDVERLSPAQLNYKPDSTRWSVAQCVEHITLAEGELWQWCMMGLKNDTSSLKKPEKQITNEQLVAGVTDRTKKAQAPEALRPKNTFSNTQAALKVFLSKRDSTIAYLKTTQDPLRERFMQTPIGLLDVYQGLLLLAAHSERHTLQLEEVMKSSGFPKNKRYA